MDPVIKLVLISSRTRWRNLWINLLGAGLVPRFWTRSNRHRDQFYEN